MMAYQLPKKISILPEVEVAAKVVPPPKLYSVICFNDGTCGVACNGQTMFTGMSSSGAWELVGKVSQFVAITTP
jgi:hypothetical protein